MELILKQLAYRKYVIQIRQNTKTNNYFVYIKTDDMRQFSPVRDISRVPFTNKQAALDYCQLVFGV